MLLGLAVLLVISNLVALFLYDIIYDVIGYLKRKYQTLEDDGG